MTTHQTVDPTRFRILLDRWNTHQTLRRDGASIAVLARSRFDLDTARRNAHRAL